MYYITTCENCETYITYTTDDINKTVQCPRCHEECYCSGRYCKYQDEEEK